MTPKPKPTKSTRKTSPLCRCAPLYINRADYKVCFKCRKPHKPHKIRRVLERILDTMVREIVLRRDGFCVCPVPLAGRHGEKRQPGHLITRGKESVKWDLRNVNEQCQVCNILHEHYPERYNNWYANKFGMESYNDLCEDGDVSIKLSIEELETLMAQLAEVNRMQLADKNFKPRFSQKQLLSGEWKGMTKAAYGLSGFYSVTGTSINPSIPLENSQGVRQ